MIDNPKNIYHQCLDNTEVFYIPWGERAGPILDLKQKQYESQGYKVVYVDASYGISYGARTVLYHENQTIPLQMQDYKNKWVKIKDGKWIREALLGICDICGIYTELPLFDKGGRKCKSCAERC